MRRLAALALVAAAPAFAQPAPPPPPGATGMTIRGDTSRPVAAGTYTIDPGHTQVAFVVSHLGISPYSGVVADASGTLTIDPAKPDATKLSVSVPMAAINTTSEKLTAELKSADWFDAARYPTATFVSTAVRVRGTGAVIEGRLTMHGVTKPMTISARLFGSAVNPMSKAPSIGFIGKATIKRSDFGVTKYVPMVSDEVDLVFNAAFEKK